MNTRTRYTNPTCRLAGRMHQSPQISATKRPKCHPCASPATGMNTLLPSYPKSNATHPTIDIAKIFSILFDACGVNLCEYDVVCVINNLLFCPKNNELCLNCINCFDLRHGFTLCSASDTAPRPRSATHLTPRLSRKLLEFYIAYCVFVCDNNVNHMH